jgi:hypothetical protein
MRRAHQEVVMAAPVVPANRPGSQIHELSSAEGWALLDTRARYYLGIGAEEFVRRWQAGEYRDADRPEVLRVVMALPFARGPR